MTLVLPERGSLVYNVIKTIPPAPLPPLGGGDIGESGPGYRRVVVNPRDALPVRTPVTPASDSEGTVTPRGATLGSEALQKAFNATGSQLVGTGPASSSGSTLPATGASFYGTSSLAPSTFEEDFKRWLPILLVGVAVFFIWKVT